MCEELQKLGLVENRYTQSVMDRENIFSTSIGNLVAIPHALNTEKPDSFIAVGILSKSIPWGMEKVQLILLLHLAPSSRQQFNAVYEKLFDIINEKKKVDKILKTHNFKEFIQVFHE